jgi:hypothetical protein
MKLCKKSFKISKGLSEVYIDEGQTIKRPNENGQKYKQWSTKHQKENQRSNITYPTKNSCAYGN